MKIENIKHADKNPNMPDFNGNHYRITVSNSGNRISFYWSSGYGIQGEPTLLNIQETIKAEYFDGSYDDFVFEFGDYANKTRFRNIQRFTDKIIKLFGSKELAEKFVYGNDSV